MLHSKWGIRELCQDDEYFCKLELRKSSENGVLIYYENGEIYKKKCTLYQDEESAKLWWVATKQFGPRYFTFDKKNVFNIWPDYPYKLSKKQLEIFDNATGYYWHNRFKDRFL